MAYAFNDDKSKFDLDTLAGNMATIEVSPTVSNHSTGEYILYDDVLYEVISPIATGESLVLGTNVRSINIGDQLKSLQDFVSLKNARFTNSFGTGVSGQGVTWAVTIGNILIMKIVVNCTTTSWTNIATFDVGNSRNGVTNIITSDGSVGRIAMAGYTLQIRNATSGSHDYESIDVFAVDLA